MTAPPVVRWIGREKEKAPGRAAAHEAQVAVLVDPGDDAVAAEADGRDDRRLRLCAAPSRCGAVARPVSPMRAA